VIAAALHMRRRVRLVAVVCNGGGDPAARARLARCVLDHVGAVRVPVGVGSAGVPYEPKPHEYTLDGYADVDERRLLDGATLLLRALRGAARKSLRVVLISSLRDFAELCERHADLVVDRVHTVAIQGGLERTADGGWTPDSSSNNCFDAAAAAIVYAFCLARGVPMIVTSRHAVPLLPMHLARSFALRMPDNAVLAYLSRAQSLGLVGLWAKVCAGELPSRCTKQWFFATFCGVGAAEFEAQALCTLGAETSILPHLNGCARARARAQRDARHAASRARAQRRVGRVFAGPSVHVRAPPRARADRRSRACASPFGLWSLRPAARPAARDAGDARAPRRRQLRDAVRRMRVDDGAAKRAGRAAAVGRGARARHRPPALPLRGTDDRPLEYSQPLARRVP
jgi:hypothetical protein